MLPCCRVMPSPADSGLTTESCSSVVSASHPEVNISGSITHGLYSNKEIKYQYSYSRMDRTKFPGHF